MPTFPAELAWTPIEQHRRMFLVLKEGTLPDRALGGECVGFDIVNIALRLDKIPVTVVIPWSNIAGVLPLAPDWSLQGDKDQEALLNVIARFWGAGKPIQGSNLKKLEELYAQIVKQQESRG